MSWLGLDIGGANLEGGQRGGLGAFGSVRAVARSARIGGCAGCARSKARPRPIDLAVTMTGELCDCFRTKAEGVRHILSAVHDVAERSDVRVYLVDGRFVTACGSDRVADYWPRRAIGVRSRNSRAGLRRTARDF